MEFFKKHKIIILFCLGICLIAIGYLFNSNFGNTYQLNNAKSEIEKKIHPLEEELNHFLDTIKKGQIENIEIQKIPDLIWKKYKGNPHLFMVYYKDNIPVFWTNNIVIPNNIEKFSDSLPNFYKLENGYYEIIKREIKSGVHCLGIIPIYNKYEINNKYFKDGFLFEKSKLRNVIIVNENLAQSEIIINDFKNRALFSISPNAFNPILSTFWGNLLQFFGVIFLIIALNFAVNYFAFSRNNLPIALGIIILFFVEFEFIIQQTNLFPISKSSGVFLPNIFASPIYGNSLGVLLFRLFMLLWITIVLYKKAIILKRNKPRTSSNTIFKLFFSQAIFLFLFLVMVGMTKSLVFDSIISFDFSNFNHFDIYTFIGLLAFCLESLIILFASKILHINSNKKGYIYWIILTFNIVIAFTLCYYFKFFKEINDILFYGIWLFVFYISINLNSKLFTVQLRLGFIRNIVSLFLISILLSYTIIINNKEKEIDRKKYTLKEIDSQRDMGEEFSFIESGKKLKGDNFVSNYFNNPYFSNFDLEQRVIKEYLNLFTNKYDYFIYAFNTDGRPLKGTNEKSLVEINENYISSDKIAISENFFYFPTSKSGCKYIGKFLFYNNEKRETGFMFIEIFPKFFGSNSIYPELLNPGKVSNESRFENQSFALYNRQKLISQLGDYEYNTNFNFRPNTKKDFYSVKANGYEHLIYTVNQKHLIISNKPASFYSKFSTFSYIFFFLLFFNFLLDYTLIRPFRKKNAELKDEFGAITLQSRIQVSMILLVIFSLFFVGIVTLYFFQNQYKNYHNNRLFKKVDVVVKDLGYILAESVKSDDANAFQVLLEENIKELTEIHSVDLNVFNIQGNLLVSSQSDIFKRGLISNKMNSEAFYNLFFLNKSKYFHDEKIGNLAFLSAYQPLKSKEGKLLGYLNFPYYGREKNLKEDISYFIITIINVYLLMIMAASILAILLSRSITYSLFLITENLKQVQFGKINLPIKWEVKDEIGLLIQEYNRMINELETSADLLAKSEREIAWREMAKQVAHEIKNPLTPMKLSIQHLQRALYEKRDDVNELTEKVTGRLIEQIDILSDIASAFSDFAKMPSDNFEQINLTKILKSSAELFNDPGKNDIILSFPSEPFIVFGDKNQLTRVFNNILKNAIQAIPEDRIGFIEIDLSTKDNFYKISIKDNGVGISNDQKDRIFVPNFTTKNSGSGLGLAMSKNIIEKIGGSISFVSAENEGTIFTILIPSKNEMIKK